MVTSTRLNIRLHAVFLYCLATRYVYPHLILSSFLLQFYKSFFLNTVKPALNGPFIKTEFVLNGNIFYVPWHWGWNKRKISWIKRKLCNAETEIKISLDTENFQSSGMHRVEEL